MLQYFWKFILANTQWQQTMKKHLWMYDGDVTHLFFLIDDPTNPNGQIVNFRFRSVLFGSCSPLILNAILMKHFKENVYMHAEVNRRSLNWQHNFKTRTEEELISLYNQIRSIFAKAGFNLRTWGSHNEVLKKCRKDEMLDKDCVFKVLEISKRIM